MSNGDYERTYAEMDKLVPPDFARLASEEAKLEKQWQGDHSPHTLYNLYRVKGRKESK